MASIVFYEIESDFKPVNLINFKDVHAAGEGDAGDRGCASLTFSRSVVCYIHH